MLTRRRCARSRRRIVPDIDALLAASKAPEVQAEYQRYTDQAPADGVFGSPFYLYGEEILWGQDRLDFLGEALAEKRGTK